MCGISGLLDSRASHSPAENIRIVKAMTDRLTHRGPDADGFWQDDAAGVFLGHRRLSILDLSAAGAQPMASADGRYVITYNGEIYNVVALRADLIAAGCAFRGTSDTEVLTQGLSVWGLDGLAPRLNGMFAFACWDRQERQLSFVRDRLGKKPLYFARTPHALIFGSELKALMCHPHFPAERDSVGLGSYLQTGHFPVGRTMFRDVKQVPAATIMTFDAQGEVRASRGYWSLAEVALRGCADPLRGGEGEALEATEALLQDAVSTRMISDVPLGSFLSGGIDSSLVTALMQEASSRPVRTFSVGYDDAVYDESAHAAAVAAHLGADHLALTVSPQDVIDLIPRLPDIYDEPFADPSQMPTALIAQKARDHVTVVLTGDGGDEVFGGYNRHVAAAGALKKIDALPSPLRSALRLGLGVFSEDQWDQLSRFVPAAMRPRQLGEKITKLADAIAAPGMDRYARLTSQWNGNLRPALSQAADYPDEWRGVFAQLPDAVAQYRFMDLSSYLQADILTKVDRATMAFGLESRSPLLDYRLIELSWRIPSSVHVHSGKGKHILRRMLSKRVPDALINRPKMGFGVPIDSWMRDELRDWAEDLLRPDQIEQTGLLDAAEVKRLWALHQSGAANLQYGLWNIVMLMAWQRRYAALSGGQA